MQVKSRRHPGRTELAELVVKIRDAYFWRGEIQFGKDGAILFDRLSYFSIKLRKGIVRSLFCIFFCILIVTKSRLGWSGESFPLKLIVSEPKIYTNTSSDPSGTMTLSESKYCWNSWPKGRTILDRMLER